MYYPSAEFGDDMSSGFCFRMLTCIHTYTHTYRADKRPIHTGDYTSASVLRILFHSLYKTPENSHCITLAVVSNRGSSTLGQGDTCPPDSLVALSPDSKAS